MNTEPLWLRQLFERSRTAALNGKLLNLWQASAIVIVVIGLGLLYGMLGGRDILAGRIHHALLHCTVAAMMLLTSPIHVYNFLRVRRGERVVNPFWVLTKSFESVGVPLSIKVALVGSLTVLVSVVSYVSLSPFHSATHVHFAARFVMIILGFNFFLWVVVAFAWYLFVIMHEHRPQKTELALEQGKDVWPPAPTQRGDKLQD